MNQDIAAVAEGAERFARVMFGADRARSLGLRDAAGRDDEALRAAGADGWLSLLAPESVGGAEQGFGAACAVAEAFARNLAPISYGSLASALPVLASMEFEALDGCLRGKHVVACVISAQQDAHLRLDAKETISGLSRGVFWAGAADYFLVHARDDDGPVLAVVARGTDGLSVAAHRTVDGFGVADLQFDQVQVGRLLRGEKAARAIAALRASLAILSAAELIGVSQAALDLTLEHLKTRQQFGRPLASFQALQFKAVDAYVGLSLARSLVEQGARLLDRGVAGGEAAAYAARAKASEAAMFLHRAAIQMHGAIGFSDEHSVGLCLKRALGLSVAWGNATRWRQAATQVSGDAAGAVFRSDTAEDAAFRSQVRSWIAANLPDHLRHLPTRPCVADALWWHAKLFERGWIAPSWSKDHGGMGARVAEQIILYEEMGIAGAPEISGQAIYHFGPILQIFGTEQQKARFLPDMLSGATMWCQGYSEPGAGSDLASLRTRAVRDGDMLVVNGSKIWTTWGQHADWMFALVRTNPDAKKQEGITFLVIDMKSAGVTRRPIRTIAGEEEFAEIFFDDVRVPIENVVGEIDGGWRVANAVLEKERLHGANPVRCAQILARIKSAAAVAGLLEDAGFADRLARAQIDYVALCATFAQIVEIAETGSRTRGDFAFAKLVSGELQQQLYELLAEACGPFAAVSDPLAFGDDRITPGVAYLQNRRVTIYGGSSEVQRLLIARRSLGLTSPR